VIVSIASPARRGATTLFQMTLGSLSMRRRSSGLERSVAVASGAGVLEFQSVVQSVDSEFVFVPTITLYRERLPYNLVANRRSIYQF
jgi:hypothetical protein